MNCMDEIKRKLKCMDRIKRNNESLSKNGNNAN